jgi:hypothetical protein
VIEFIKCFVVGAILLGLGILGVVLIGTYPKAAGVVMVVCFATALGLMVRNM